MIGRLLLVGCGKMGRALLDGWLASKMVAHVDVVEPGTASVPEDARVSHYLTADQPSEMPDVVVLAVKPQSMDAVIGQYQRFVRPGCVFLSIAAGKSLSYLQDHLGKHAALVRVMPNTPAAVGKGISVLVADADASASTRRYASI